MTSGTPAVSAGLGWPATLSRPAGPAATAGGGLGWPGVDGKVVSVDRGTVADVVTPAAPTPPVPEPVEPPPDAAQTPVPRGTGGSTDEDTPIARAARVAVRLRSPDPADAFPHPGRPRVVVVANQKGGVGKTTSTVNLGAALALHGQRVLVIDLDPQGNASTALGIDHPAGTPSIYDVVIEGRDLAEVVQDSPGVAGLTVAPATIDLAGAEIELVPMVAREARLRRAVTAHLAGHDEGSRPDYVLIDSPPSLGLLTLNALVAADEVLIPIQCEYYALEGLGQLVKTIDMVTTHLNEGLRISTILLTMYDARTRLAAQVAQEVRDHFTDRVLATAVPRSVRVSEAPSYGQTVLTYDPGSPGSLAYVEAAREISASLPH